MSTYNPVFADTDPFFNKIWGVVNPRHSAGASTRPLLTPP